MILQTENAQGSISKQTLKKVLNCWKHYERWIGSGILHGSSLRASKNYRPIYKNSDKGIKRKNKVVYAKNGMTSKDGISF